MRVLRIAAVVALAAASAACASITAGSTQSIAVQTSPEAGAQCELRNDKGAWTIPSTPGSTSISKSYDDMTIVCSTPTGWNGSTSIRSETAGAAFGNIIAGGLIGAAVDMSSGAAYLYPSSAIVMMTRQPEPKADTPAPEPKADTSAPEPKADTPAAVPVLGMTLVDDAPAKPATEIPVSLLPTAGQARAAEAARGDARILAERLSELDDLYRRGVIDAEYFARRRVMLLEQR
ncbi:hypothetical protein GCM10011505_42450 [Tistrella bauzanensis]|uniref:SHOCT domain-containing protein n=1 Tax=Tistrella bauzanensis TaxID=657419 RepID=A0ABQ1J2H5_9PROT|nr:hypothetical protein [Tistrella bauzanensis]GGB57056.1 hypothetical protein GCM10011505_42450 [Tistrella bauzanensis]